MVRFRFVAIMLLPGLTLANLSFSQDDEIVDRDRVKENHRRVLEPDCPISIFNDKVCRFRFHLEDMLVSTETAEQFILRYRGQDYPEIIGAYADTESNSLVVVSGPEAETAVRISLASWLVERQGLGTTPLKMQKRVLEYKRRELLGQMAELEVQSVEAEGDKEEQLQARLQYFERQLKLVEKQIQVVNKYFKRLDEEFSQTDSDTASAR